MGFACTHNDGNAHFQLEVSEKEFSPYKFTDPMKKNSWGSVNPRSIIPMLCDRKTRRPLLPSAIHSPIVNEITVSNFDEFIF